MMTEKQMTEFTRRFNRHLLLHLNPLRLDPAGWAVVFDCPVDDVLALCKAFNIDPPVEGPEVTVEVDIEPPPPDAADFDDARDCYLRYALGYLPLYRLARELDRPISRVKHRLGQLGLNHRWRATKSGRDRRQVVSFQAYAKEYEARPALTGVATTADSWDALYKDLGLN